MRKPGLYEVARLPVVEMIERKTTVVAEVILQDFNRYAPEAVDLSPGISEDDLIDYVMTQIKAKAVEEGQTKAYQENRHYIGLLCREIHRLATTS